jgi:hypothetical protein
MNHPPLEVPHMYPKVVKNGKIKKHQVRLIESFRPAMNWMRSRSLYLLRIDLSWISIEEILYLKSDRRSPTIIFDSPFVLIKNALLHSPSGHLFLIDHERSERPILIKESTYWEPIHAQYSHGLVPKKHVNPLNIDSPIGCIPRSENYFHWVLDELPEVIKLSRVSQTIKFVYSGKLASYQLEALNLLSIQPNLIEPWVIAPYVAVSQERNLTGEINLSNINLLEEFTKNIEEKEDFSYIYISRKRSARQLQNEDIVEDILSKIGFRILYLEEVSFLTQIQIFKSAKIIIGPHGAGFANIVFSRKGVQVIEIYQKDYFNACFKDIAEAKSLGYTSIDYATLKIMLFEKPWSNPQDLLRTLSTTK